MKLTLALAAGLATVLTALPASAAPVAAKIPVEALAAGELPTTFVQYRRFGGHHGYGRGYGRGYGYGYGRGYRRGPGVGAAVGAGVAGLAAGALIGGAIANSQAQAAPVVVQGGGDPELVAECARRFKTYDASSGTYVASGGVRRSCP